jgi:hypothetical protein
MRITKVSLILINLELQDLVDYYVAISKKLQIKFLTNMSFEYQMKVYETKIQNQLKIFLE